LIMELAWIVEPKPACVSRERSVCGHTLFLGPFIFGNFKYDDAEGGGFWFFNVRGTRFNVSREW